MLLGRLGLFRLDERGRFWRFRYLENDVFIYPLMCCFAMGDVIYGVDLSGEVTPVIARDAIVACFKDAHREVIDSLHEDTKWESDDERENFSNMKIGDLIKNAFKETGVDYDNPDKDDLVLVLDKLAKLASGFRSPEIIKRHYGEMKRLVDAIK